VVLADSKLQEWPIRPSCKPLDSINRLQIYLMEFGLLINTRQLQTYSLELNSEELMKNFAIAVLMALMCVAALSYGQAIDANLVGTVVDASGSAVPNANIEIRHIATGVKTDTKTNVDGQYRLNNIPIGLYNVTATASGFATATLSKPRPSGNRCHAQADNPRKALCRGP